jgi:DNA-binding IclR family transcriptional regulator
MSGVMGRTLALLERLSGNVQGVPLATLADELHIPRSAVHRLLLELSEHGYVRQSRGRGDYMLTTKLVSLAQLPEGSGVVDLCADPRPAGRIERRTGAWVSSMSIT